MNYVPMWLKSTHTMQQKFIFWLAKLIAPLIIKWRGNLYHYKRAIRKAEKLAGASYSPFRGLGGWRDGKRHYIYFFGGQYRVLNRKQIQYWRNKKVLKHNLSASRMTGIQLYDTMGHVNSHPTYTQVEVKGISITYKRTKDLCTSKPTK